MRKTKNIDAFLVRDTYEPLYSGQINMDVNDLNDSTTVYSVSRENDVEGVMQMARNQHINTGKIRAKVISATVNNNNVPASRFPVTKTVTLNGKKYCFAKGHIVDHGLHGCYLDPCAPGLSATQVALRYDLLPWFHSEGATVNAPKAGSSIHVEFEHGPASGHQRNPHYTAIVDDGNIAVAHRDCDLKDLNNTIEVLDLVQYGNPNKIARGALLSGQLCNRLGVDSILNGGGPGTTGTINGPLMNASEDQLTAGQKKVRQKIKELKGKGWIDDEAQFLEDLIAASMAMADQESSWSPTNPGDSSAEGIKVSLKPYEGAPKKEIKACSFGFWQYNICAGAGIRYLEHYGFHTPGNDAEGNPKKNKHNAKMNGKRWNQAHQAGMTTDEIQAWENSIVTAMTDPNKNVEFFVEGVLARDEFWKSLDKIYHAKSAPGRKIQPVAPNPRHKIPACRGGQPEGWAVDRTNTEKITDKDIASLLINGFEKPCAGVRPGRERNTPRQMLNIKALGLAGCNKSSLASFANNNNIQRGSDNRPCIDKKAWNDKSLTIGERQAIAHNAYRMNKGIKPKYCPDDDGNETSAADLWGDDGNLVPPPTNP